MSYIHVGLNHFLILASLIFALGLYGVIVKKSIFAKLMAFQLVLAAVNIIIEAFSVFEKSTYAGQILPVFVILTESFVISAICFAALKYYRNSNSEKNELMNK